MTDTITTKDGTVIYFKDWGPKDAKPIVFHHGWPLSADDWDTQLLFFVQHGYRVVAYDRRGHGRSSQVSDGHDMDHYAADVAVLVDHLNLRDAVHIGHSACGGVVARYVARLGLDNAKRLFLTAEKLGAAEMLRIGYLTSVVPAEALDEEVDRLAAVLAGNAPVAMRGMKRAINEFARGKLDEAAADRRARDSMRGAEIKEGIKAFAEKRPPKF